MKTHNLTDAKIRARGSLILMALALLSGCADARKQAQPVVDRAAITAAIDSLNKAFAAAVNAHDPGLVVGFYAEGAQLLRPSEPRREGQDSIRTAWADFLRTPDLKLTITSTHKLISEAGDMAIDVGAYDLTGKDPKGTPIHDVGKYVIVLKKVNGEWKIVVDTFNSDMPPSGQAES